MLACSGDERRCGLQSRDTLQVSCLPELADVWPASLVQRIRKRRCFADSDLERSSLLSEGVLWSGVFNDVIATPPRRVSRDTGRHVTDHHDVNTSSRGHAAPGWVPAGWHDVTNARLPPVSQLSAANDELERRDVTMTRRSSSSSSREVSSDWWLRTTSVQLVVPLTSSSSSSSASRTSLNFSVESLLAK